MDKGIVSYRIIVIKETENNSRRPNSNSFSDKLKYYAEASVFPYAQRITMIDRSNQYDVMIEILSI